MKAGVMEGGEVKATTEGTPQGGILSPVLANIYLHYVLDLWFTKRERKVLKGYNQLIRYADDFVIGSQYETEAKAIQGDVTERLKEFGLTVSAEKTKLIEFGRFAEENRKRRGEKKPETFDFLGFSHYCDHTRDGRYAIKVKTSRGRFKRSLKRLNNWFRAMRSKLSIQTLWPIVQMKVQGHYQYYGVSGNFTAIQRYYYHSRHIAYKWLNRRSQKRSMDWEEFSNYTKRFSLPQPKLTYAFYNTW
jgi:hypothetical protein